MSDREVSIVLKAKDEISRVFRQVGDAGKKMGDDLSRGADQAERDLRDLGTTAKTTGRDLDQLKRDAQNLGLGIGALVGGFALASKSFRDQEIGLNTLRRSYGEAADGLEEFSRALAENSNYSEEAVISAANVAGTLARNYGATAAEIQQILQISADLAATSGFTLEDASQRVVAALRGEAEAAEQLGLTMNQQAIDRNNLTLSMSNQEAFQFRLNALTEQSAFAMGAASEQADTMYGAMTDIEDSVRNAGQAVAGFSPELAGMGAYLAENALQVAGLSLAVGQMGRAFVAASRLAGMSLIGAGGLIAGISLAAVGIVKLAQHFQDDYVSAAEAADEATESWRQTVQALADDALLAGQNIGLVLAGSAITDVLEETGALADANHNLAESYVLVASSLSTGGAFALYSEGLNDLTRAQQEAADANKDGALTYDELNAAAAALGETLMATGETADVFAANWAAAQAPMLEIMQQQGEAGIAAREQLAQYLQYLDDGVIASSGFLTSVTEIRDAMIDQAQAAEIAAASGRPWFEVLAQQNAAMAQFSGLGQHVMDFWGGYVPAVEEATEALANHDALLQMVTQHWNVMSVEAARAQAPLVAAANQLDIIGANWNVMSVEAAQAAHDTAEAVAYLSGELETAFENVRREYTQTSDALSSGFQVAVGNTNSIAQQSESVNDWAMELVNVRGILGDIDKIYAQGSPQWEAAQQAQESIAASNERIQRSILQIQSDQIPVVAELLNQQEDYVQSIADMGPEAQMLALAYMDAATSAQALELAQAAIGDMDTFGPMLVQAAELNPYLAAILKDMGLISEIDGEIVLTADAEGAKSEVALLTDAIIALTDAIHVAFIDADTSGAQAGFDTAATWFDNWDGSTAIASIMVNDYASDAIGDALALLRDFNNSSATATMTTVYQSIGTPGGMFFQHGGIIDEAQMGRMLAQPTWVGEAGPELLLGGNHVLPHTASMQTGGNTGGMNVTVNIENLYGDETLAEKVSAEIVPALQRAMALHARAY